MKKLILVMFAALALAGCGKGTDDPSDPSSGNNNLPDPAGYQMFTSISELKSWLAAQPDNTVATAYKVGLKDLYINAAWSDLGIALGSKFVDLNMQKCTSPAIPDGYYEYVNATSFIVHGAFVGSKLVAITLPAGLQTIGKDAFYRCYSLSSVVLPDGLTEIHDCAFQMCSGITSITLPGSLTMIGDNVFDGCKIASIALPEGLKTIGLEAFRACPLTSVTVPSTVTAIGEWAFPYGVAAVVMRPATPPALGGTGCFDTDAYSKLNPSLVIKVPAASVNSYKTAAIWSKYAANIVADTN